MREWRQSATCTVTCDSHVTCLGSPLQTGGAHTSKQAAATRSPLDTPARRRARFPQLRACGRAPRAAARRRQRADAAGCCPYLPFPCHIVCCCPPAGDLTLCAGVTPVRRTAQPTESCLSCKRSWRYVIRSARGSASSQLAAAHTCMAGSCSAGDLNVGLRAAVIELDFAIKRRLQTDGLVTWLVRRVARCCQRGTAPQNEKRVVADHKKSGGLSSAHTCRQVGPVG